MQQNGLILGFVQNQGYTELEEPLRTDDRFLLYTDGLIEACNADDDLFGLERRFGAFHCTDLELILRSRGIDTVIITGIATNVCAETSPTRYLYVA